MNVPSRALLAHILGQVREGVMLVDARSGLLFANPQALKLIGDGGPLALRAGRIRCHDPASDRLLQRTVESACAADATYAQSLIIRQRERIATVVTVKCARAAGQDAHALLIAVRPDPDVRNLVATIRACFGLTLSEAEVAAEIGAGRSLFEIANSRGVSINTIRTQVKRIAAKLGCARQSQIAVIVNAVPPSPEAGPGLGPEPEPQQMSRTGTKMLSGGRHPDG